MKRVKILYEGRGQGVGFRYTCMALAQELGLTGYVKNLEDGDVELVLQGDEAAINRFRMRLPAENHWMRIDHETETELRADPSEKKFRYEFGGYGYY